MSGELKPSEPTKVERTGEKSLVVHHDDGSKFECTFDPKKTPLKEDLRTDSRFYIPDTVGVKNIMSNADRRRMGLEPDPALPE